MALVSDGSRICDASRVALGAIDQSVVLHSQFRPFIYAGGVDLAAGDSLTIAAGAIDWEWRIDGGTFDNVGAATEIRWANDVTVLVDFGTLANANKRTNQTATSTEALREFETTWNGAPSVDLIDEVSSESQIALRASGAIPGATYEMQGSYTHTAGTTNIPYPAKIIIPIFKNNYAEHPKAMLRN